MPEKKRKRAPRKSLIEKLPENIREAPVMRRQSVRPKGSAKYLRDMLLLFLPEINRLVYASIHNGAARGVKADKELWLELTGQIKRGGGGINVNQILNQQNKVDSGGAPRYSMDQIVRELQATKDQQVIDVTPMLGGGDGSPVAVEA